MRILIVTTNKFPQGDAGAVREESFAKLFCLLGHEVCVVGLGESTSFNSVNYKGFSYYSLKSKGRNLISRLLNLLLFTSRLRHFVLRKEEQFDVVFVSEISIRTIKWLKEQAKKSCFSLMHDSVEWYSPEQFINGDRARAYKDKEKLNSSIIDDNFKVVAISSFLEKHFLDKGIKTVRIPVILDVEEILCIKTKSEDRTVFLYAGMPGKKDYLAEIVSSFSLLNDNEKKCCEFRILGITEDQLYNDCGVNIDLRNSLSGLIKCFGRQPRQEVLKQLSQADYTLLLRNPNLRYSKAGFPTKFSESMATGTPVISNLTSDLKFYLNDGKNGFVCKSCSPEDMCKCIRKAISLSLHERLEMDGNARRTAEEFFDYRKYKKQIEMLLGRECRGTDVYESTS